jgi:hypothetical protein
MLHRAFGSIAANGWRPRPGGEAHYVDKLISAYLSMYIAFMLCREKKCRF